MAHPEGSEELAAMFDVVDGFAKTVTLLDRQGLPVDDGQGSPVTFPVIEDLEALEIGIGAPVPAAGVDHTVLAKHVDVAGIVQGGMQVQLPSGQVFRVRKNPRPTDPLGEGTASLELVRASPVPYT